MKLRFAIIHVAFALTGIVTTMLGPILPLLAARWSLNDAQAGRLFMAQFLSSVTGALIARRVVAGWGTLRTVLIGLFITAVGVAGVGVGVVTVGVAAISTFGVGLGFALPSTNLMVAELVPERRASALNLLNFSWTVGALVAPVAIAAMLKPFGFRGSLLILAGCVFASGCALASGIHIDEVVATVAREGRLRSSSRKWFAIISTLLLFLYVGAENGFAGWVFSFSIRSQHTSQAVTAFIQSGFWAAILFGRLIAPLVLRKLEGARIIQFGLATASVGIILAAASNSVVMLGCGVVICGLGLSAVFPTAVAAFTDDYGTAGAGSVVLGACGLGGAVVPWAVGTVSSHCGNLRLGLLVTLLCTAGGLLAFWQMQSIARRPTQGARSRNEFSAIE